MKDLALLACLPVSTVVGVACVPVHLMSPGLSSVHGFLFFLIMAKSHKLKIDVLTI